MRARTAFSGLLLGAVMMGGVNAADLKHGETIAQRWCAACHVIGPGQAVAKADAPTFERIAKSRAAQQLRVFLANPYPRMPDMSLSRDEIDDLVAYIKSFGLAPGETPPTAPAQPDTPDHEHRG